jgi:hypothetical protein
LALTQAKLHYKTLLHLQQKFVMGARREWMAAAASSARCPFVLKF